jgi:hypothetical protein
MKIEAIYDHSRLEFTRPVQFKHGRVRLIVDLPEEAILAESITEAQAAEKPTYNTLAPEVQALAEAMMERLERIRNAPLPPEEALPPLTEKQQERIEAYALRAQRREEQGRP